jgi:hypothetical protein
MGLIVGALATPLSGSAQDGQETVVAELVIVAPASGPAWWKVSKGDASVWILGLQPSTPQGLEWDQSTLRRRLEGARLMLGVYYEKARFEPDVEHPPLPPDLADDVAALSVRLGARRRDNLRAPSQGAGADRSSPRGVAPGLDRTTAAFDQGANRPAYRPRPRGPATVVDLMRLRPQYAVDAKLGSYVLDEINAIARRARVSVVTPPVYEFTWQPAALAPDNPVANRCLRAIVADLNTPPDRYREAAALWAKGDVRGMLDATPPTIEPECGYLWPGYRERTIAFQTSLIAQALDRPGKVVAVALTSHLVARDGILERLRAQGFTIADPSKPLEE